MREIERRRSKEEEMEGQFSKLKNELSRVLQWGQDLTLSYECLVSQHEDLKRVQETDRLRLDNESAMAKRFREERNQELQKYLHLLNTYLLPNIYLTSRLIIIIIRIAIEFYGRSICGIVTHAVLASS